MKRLFDISAALAGLVVLAPVIGILVFMVRRDSPGPGIFAQQRVGRHGTIFTCYKLRTMAAEAPNVPTHFAKAAQITRLGGVLRRTKLDEVPQLWNVLVGEMSLVGPRPCLPTQTELIEERRRRGVLDILPGITGLAQVEGVDMSDPVRLAEIDARYCRTRSFTRDLVLLYRTVRGSGQGDRVS